MSQLVLAPRRSQRSNMAKVTVVICLSVSLAGCALPVSTRTKPVTSTAATPALLTPVPMKATPIDESGPGAQGNWFVWERFNHTKGRANYWAQRNGGRWIRINAKGTLGHDGDVGPGRVLYSQARYRRYRELPTDLWQYNLSTGHRLRLPGPVNTRAYESLPSVSGRYLLFQRLVRPDPYAVAARKVMLFDRRAQVLTTLAVAHQQPRDDYAPVVEAGQLNGGYATWRRVAWTEQGVSDGSFYDAPQSEVALYDVETGTTTRYRLRPSTYLSTTAVSSGGTLYYIRYGINASRTGDETRTRNYFMKRPLGGTPEVIAKMPRCFEIRDLYVDDRSDGSHRLYFTVWTHRGADIYKITDPPPTAN